MIKAIIRAVLGPLDQFNHDVYILIVPRRYNLIKTCALPFAS